MGYPQPDSRIRAVDASRSPARSEMDAILRLQAASRDDKAGVGYVRPIRLDLALAIRAIFSGQGRSTILPKRSAQQRKQQLG
jgi:hypothetical protein